MREWSPCAASIRAMPPQQRGDVARIVFRAPGLEMKPDCSQAEPASDPAGSTTPSDVCVRPAMPRAVPAAIVIKGQRHSNDDPENATTHVHICPAISSTR